VTAKVVSIHEAIEKNVAPGMVVHLGLQAGAATCELARQFWGSKPEFTLIMNMIGGHHALSLIHGGLVKKLVFATCADIYPRPLPNPVIQRAFKNNTCKLENWSMLSLTQAVMAGALNLPYIPTRSVIGSSLADDNQDAIRIVDDVFNGGEKVALIKSLCPDLSIVHGWAADHMGNVILSGPPRDAWAAKASRNGVMVCVEKLVDEDFIRNHSLLVKIPGSLVNAVCVAPGGAHPQNMSAQSLPAFEGYGLDYDYLAAFRKATEDAEAYSQWVKDWILDCPSHDAYLDKLKSWKAVYRKAAAQRRTTTAQSKKPSAAAAHEKGATATELAIIGGARAIKDIVLARQYNSMFAGIGLSGLAGWCAYYFLKDLNYHVDLIAAGIGYQPCPGDPLLISAANMATAKMISDSLDLHGVGAGGINSRCLGVLGAGQIDKNGNINSTIIQTRTKGDIYLAGAGGGNDIASVTREVVVVAVHRANRMVEKVRYITCPGTRVSTLATNEGLFVKNDTGFVLTGYYPNPEVPKLKERIRQIEDACGWEMRTAPQLEKMQAPTPEELKLLRSFDPDGVFLR
jgi:acyl CoA:acetate/3-ketoacid CoA transferase alpha subunit/acyl CoA:acetate/3-ketoacid CoA transferase beta subunit